MTTLISLVGNISHALLPYISPIVIQIGAAAVPPIALLAAVHGIAVADRAGRPGGFIAGRSVLLQPSALARSPCVFWRCAI